MNAAYLFDRQARMGLVNALQHGDAGAAHEVRPEGPPVTDELVDVTEPDVSPLFEPFRGLSSTSLALSRSRITQATPSVNLLLPEVTPYSVFAGVKTALQFGAELARSLSRPLRLITTNSGDAGSGGHSALDQERYLREYHFDGLGDESFAVVRREQLAGFAFGEEDAWIATHWSTAHALDVAVRAALLDPRRVVYLIQDFEPGFNPWSTEYALALSTYHAGFVPVVNSTPLAHYLGQEVRVAVNPQLVFSPHFDIEQLDAARRARTESNTVRFFFYGRPSKPRNLYSIGLAAIRLADERLASRGVSFEPLMAGEAGESVVLRHSVMQNKGALSRSDYFAMLSSIDLGLSLQMSPHPSHPPFDLALSGARAITNDFPSAPRQGLHPNIVTVDPDPTAIANAIVRAAERVLAGGNDPVATFSPDVLGAPLSDVVPRVANILGKDTA